MVKSTTVLKNYLKKQDFNLFSLSYLKKKKKKKPNYCHSGLFVIYFIVFVHPKQEEDIKNVPVFL